MHDREVKSFLRLFCLFETFFVSLRLFLVFLILFWSFWELVGPFKNFGLHCDVKDYLENVTLEVTLRKVALRIK